MSTGKGASSGTRRRRMSGRNKSASPSPEDSSPQKLAKTSVAPSTSGGSGGSKATAGGKGGENPNADIITILTELGDYEKNVTRQRFKFSAYQKAVKALKAIDYRIKSGDEAKKLDGIGEKIAKKIDEILKTGTLKKAETIRGDENNVAIADLTRVTGVGPAAAAKMVQQYQVKSIADLRANKNNVKTALTSHQLVGLKYIEDFEQRIPRAEVEALRDAIFPQVKAVDPDFLPTVCGSFRRGAATCGDVDVLLTHPKLLSDLSQVPKDLSLERVVQRLEQAGIITDTLALGDQKFMGVCLLPTKNDKKDSPPVLHRRLDIRLIPHDHFYCALLYFTGSDVFNKTMRQHALDQGFTINEYCIRPLGSTGMPGEPLPVSSEQDVFDYIGMDYKEPKDRSL